MIPLFGSSIPKILINFQKFQGDDMKLIDVLYDMLVRQRNKKQREIVRLRWQKEKLEKQLAMLKNSRRQEDT